MSAAEVFNIADRLKPKTKLECSGCGAPGEGSCNCGLPYVTPVERAEAVAKANPEKSTRDIAKEAKVSQRTAARAKQKSGEPHGSPRVKGADGKSYPSKRKTRARQTDPVEDKIAALAEQGLTSPKIAATVGLDGRAVRHVIEREEIKDAGRREAFIEIIGTEDFTKATVAQKLEAAKRMQERRLNAEHAARMRDLDEEVRQRVLSETKEYLAMLKGREEEAEKTVALYTEWTNNLKHPLTVDEWRLLSKCVHQRGLAAKPEDLDAAAVLLNLKRDTLIGRKK